MLGALAEEFVGAGIVHVDVVIVRTNCQFLSVWGVGDGFNPLLGVFVGGDNLVELGSTLSDGEGTVVVTNSNMAR